jgi:dipeptidyl aminopeptidase/acylaminoacyl peptidase
MGHSYGAFMTMNLLIHTNLFTTGIARSGAYNRTLTPFGFQDEDRFLWDSEETKEIYFKLSPLLHAEKIKVPVLLIHGIEDKNPGTYPMQSERMYEALRGLGKPARMVLLPHEDHSYIYKESILHVLAEIENWLEKMFVQ